MLSIASWVERMTKMTKSVMGSTTIRRWDERFWLSYSPAQSIL
jgi:hypothetical protein